MSLKLSFIPKAIEGPQVVVSWYPPVLTVGGVDYDLSELDDGDVAEHSVLNRASRVGDDYEVTIEIAHGPNAPYSTRFPSSINDVPEGDVALPAYEREGA